VTRLGVLLLAAMLVVSACGIKGEPQPPEPEATALP